MHDSRQRTRVRGRLCPRARPRMVRPHAGPHARASISLDQRPGRPRIGRSHGRSRVDVDDTGAARAAAVARHPRPTPKYDSHSICRTRMGSYI